MRSPEQNRERRREAREKGVCWWCHSPSIPGQTLCPQHQRRMNERKRACIDRKVEFGECLRCKHSVVPGRKHCLAHLEDNNQKRKRVVQTRRRLVPGLCSGCWCRKPDAGKRTCHGCLDKLRIRINSVKVEVFSHYGNVCHCCGERNLKFLTIDHINNDGSIHRKTLCKNPRGGSGFRLWKWIRDNSYPPGFRLLCWNCNCARAHNGGVCPHADDPTLLLAATGVV